MSSREDQTELTNLRHSRPTHFESLQSLNRIRIKSATTERHIGCSLLFAVFLVITVIGTTSFYVYQKLVDDSRFSNESSANLLPTNKKFQEILHIREQKSLEDCRKKCNSSSKESHARYWNGNECLIFESSKSSICRMHQLGFTCIPETEINGSFLVECPRNLYSTKRKLILS